MMIVSYLKNNGNSLKKRGCAKNDFYESQYKTFHFKYMMKRFQVKKSINFKNNFRTCLYLEKNLRAHYSFIYKAIKEMGNLESQSYSVLAAFNNQNGGDSNLRDLRSKSCSMQNLNVKGK